MKKRKKSWRLTEGSGGSWVPPRKHGWLFGTWKVRKKAVVGFFLSIQAAGEPGLPTYGLLRFFALQFYFQYSNF